MDPESRERLTRVEEGLKHLDERFDRFEIVCSSSKKDLTMRINKFVNHTVHQLKNDIKHAKNTNKRPWGIKEWGAIAVAIITSTGSIIIELLSRL